MRGTLSIGELAIDGELDRMPVSLGLRWDAEHRPDTMLVGVGHPDRASAAARVRLARWPEDIVDLHVVDGVARAALVGSFDATRVRDLVRELRALLAALDPEAGPYR